MMTLVSCPTCHHKFTIPEGAMGKRHTCPNCQSLFVAGKSVAEEEARKNAPSMLSAAGPSMLSAGAGAGGKAPASMDKTMLGEVDAPPIKYNCPRCKKPLEAPASEAGTKKPCPSCGGRLQVPAAPPRPAAAAVFDPLNKTLLASDESGLQASAPAPGMPLSSAPSAPSAPAATASPVAPPAKKWKIYAIAAAAVVVVGLAVVFVVGKNAAAAEQEKFLNAQKAELDKIRQEIEQKTALMDMKRQMEEENQKKWQTIVKDYEARYKKLEDERDAERKAAASDEAKKEADRKAQERKRQLEDEKKAEELARAKAEADLKNQIDALKRQVDNANQQKTTIIQQAPPPIHPWYYYGRHYPWW